MNKNEKLKAIDFFCSGGGMTHGMREAGIEVIAGIDNDPDVKETYEKNNLGTKFIQADVFKLKEIDLTKYTGIEKNDDNLILIGCSPCQYWSIIQTDKKKSKQSKDLLKEFHRFVKYYNPGFVVVENVPGLEKKAEESGLKEFIEDLESRFKMKNAQLPTRNIAKSGKVLNWEGLSPFQLHLSLIVDRSQSASCHIAKRYEQFNLIVTLQNI